MHDYGYSPYDSPPPPPRRSNVLWWILGGGATFVVMMCGGLCAGLIYFGSITPETSVYTGNRVPQKYLRTMRTVGALDDDESLLFFYSDALTDIRDGFYFVSDKRVVIYSQNAVRPLTSLPFEEITDAELYRDESFFEDSEITLYDVDGQIHSFPVSSEYNRDEQFFNAVKTRIEN